MSNLVAALGPWDWLLLLVFIGVIVWAWKTVHSR